MRAPRGPARLLPIRAAGPRAVGRLGAASPRTVARTDRKPETCLEGAGAMKRTPNTPEPIVVECDLPHEPALVWRALAERDLLAAWLLPNDLRPAAGAQFRFEHTDRHPGNRINCEVLEVEPNRVLRWRQTENGDADSGWQRVSSVVTIELAANAGGGTHL